MPPKIGPWEWGGLHWGDSYALRLPHARCRIGAIALCSLPMPPHASPTQANAGDVANVLKSVKVDAVNVLNSFSQFLLSSVPRMQAGCCQLEVLLAPAQGVHRCRTARDPRQLSIDANNNILKLLDTCSF